jgi:hypothetical protein
VQTLVANCGTASPPHIATAAVSAIFGKPTKRSCLRKFIKRWARIAVNSITWSVGTVLYDNGWDVLPGKHYQFSNVDYMHHPVTGWFIVEFNLQIQ